MNATATAEKITMLDRSYYSNVRGHLAARDDRSEYYRGATYGPDALTQPYESDCGWCYLNAPHTRDAHVANRDDYRERSRVPAR